MPGGAVLARLPHRSRRGAECLTDEGEKCFVVEGLYEKGKRAAFQRSGAGATRAFCASLTSSATETTSIFCILRGRDGS